MKERTVTHILQRKKIQEGEHFYSKTIYEALCGRAANIGYKHGIPKFYPDTCKHCIQAQITTYNRRLLGRDRRQKERRN